MPYHTFCPLEVRKHVVIEVIINDERVLRYVIWQDQRFRFKTINKNSLFREEQAVRNYCAGM
ncbi:hypothetical protein BCT58_11610 [Vibrio lentus]|uniref:Uncharacterized protein n=1 Tax=Vibrio lentus TaxID=136468 RepID=A0A2N7IIW0_9VIBR|nr:hypothetical protein BCT74_19760 [Vibrio lentus]PMM24907.1 hypothetical protein BCT58_11610 [Vibrio lentus]